MQNECQENKNDIFVIKVVLEKIQTNGAKSPKALAS